MQAQRSTLTQLPAFTPRARLSPMHSLPHHSSARHPRRALLARPCRVPSSLPDLERTTGATCSTFCSPGSPRKPQPDSSQPDARHLRALLAGPCRAPLRWSRIGRRASPVGGQSAPQLSRPLAGDPFIYGNPGAHLPVPLILPATSLLVSIFEAVNALRMRGKT